MVGPPVKLEVRQRCCGCFHKDILASTMKCRDRCCWFVVGVLGGLVANKIHSNMTFVI